LSVAGNSIDQSIGLITGITEITRDAPAAGEALKTVSMRIRGMDEETGKTDAQVKKAMQSVKGLTGVSVFSDEARNQYKSTYDVMKQIASVWDKLTDRKQAEVLEDLAGNFSLCVQKCA